MIFSVWLRIGSNPPDIDRFRSDTGKLILHKGKNMKITDKRIGRKLVEKTLKYIFE